MWVDKFIRIHSTGHSPHFLCPKKIAFPCLKSVNSIRTQSGFVLWNRLPCEWTKEFQISYVININNILEVTSNSIGLFSNEEKLSWSRSHSKTVVQTRSLDFHPIVQWSFCQIMPPLRFPKFICDVFRKVLFLKISEISEK